jgi:hypothetical protein
MFYGIRFAGQATCILTFSLTVGTWSEEVNEQLNVITNLFIY